MRGNDKKLLLVSAFFLFMTFTGCGIPSILYLADSNDYSFNAASTSDTVVGISNMLISMDDDTMLQNCSGPNVVFFYTIANHDDDASLRNASSYFNNNYTQNTYLGLPISSNTLNYHYTPSETNRTYYFYLFNTMKTSRDESQAFSAPYYNIFRTGTNAESLLSNVTLTRTTLAGSSGSSYFILAYDGDDYSDTSTILYRYNGLPFTKTYTVNNTDNNYGDYGAIYGSSGVTPYVYVYAAFTIMPNNASTFSNNFWSKAIFLGSIELT